MTYNLKNTIEKTLTKYNKILYLVENKNYEDINSKINNIIGDFTDIENYLLQHSKDVQQRRINMEYNDWCNKTINSLRKFKHKIETYYNQDKNFEQDYLNTIKSIIIHYTQPIETEINLKINNPVEWYQIVDNNDNYNQIYNNLIQPLLYPNLYSTHNNRKVLLYGKKHSGRFYFTRAIITNLLKMNSNYDIIVVKQNLITMNGVNITKESIYKMLETNPKLIIVIHHLQDNMDFYEKFFNVMEQIKPIWLIIDNNINTDLYFYDIKLEFQEFSLDTIHLLVNNYISNYLINDNPYYSCFQGFKKTMIIDNSILPQLSKLYLDRYKYLSEYEIPLLHDIPLLKKINHIIYQKNYNLFQISQIINNSIRTLGLYSIKNNSYYFYNNNIFISSLSSKKQIQENNPLYFITKPEYEELVLNDNGTGKLCRRCHDKCHKTQKYIHLDVFKDNNKLKLNLEDERITDYYILNETDNTKKCLDLIFKLEWFISNKPRIKPMEYHLSKISITIYVYMIHYLLQTGNLDFKNKDIFGKYLEKYKQINTINDLEKLHKDELRSYFSISNERSQLISNSDTQYQTIYFISNNEDNNSFYHIEFNDRSSNDIEEYENGVPINLNINELKDLILYLIDANKETEVHIIQTKKNNIYILELEFYSKINDKYIEYDVEQLFKCSTINTKDDIKVFGSINIPNNIFQLDEDYKINTIYDLDILQQYSLEEYGKLDREDIDSWKNVEISNKKHIELLNDRYDSHLKFLLFLSNKLELYNHNNPEIGSNTEHLIELIEMKLYERLEMKDEEETIIWNLSDNHHDLLNPNSNRNNTNIKISLLYWTLLLDSFEPYPNYSELIDMWYMVDSIERNKFTSKKVDIYIKSNLDIEDTELSKCYYSYYCSDKFNETFNKEHYKKYYKILLHKISNNNSLLYLLLNNSDSIGFSSSNNNIKFYPINNSNWINEIFKTNSDLVFPNIEKIIDENIYSTGIQNTLSLLLANVYNNNYKSNPTQLYLAGLLSYRNYVSNHPNYKFTEEFNILNIIEEDILNNLNLLYNYLDLEDIDKYISKKTLINSTPIAVGSLTKKSSISSKQILNDKQKNNIYSYHLRPEYILDELLI